MLKFHSTSNFQICQPFLIRQSLDFGKTYCPNRRKIIPRPKFEIRFALCITACQILGA